MTDMYVSAVCYLIKGIVFITCSFLNVGCHWRCSWQYLMLLSLAMIMTVANSSPHKINILFFICITFALDYCTIFLLILISIGNLYIFSLMSQGIFVSTDWLIMKIVETSKAITTSPIKTIASVLKDLTHLITSITTCPIHRHGR
jgi:hypothetical protein